jgi:hypothetical protein
MAHEAAYLGISAVKVSAPLFAIFKKSGVLPAQDELWKERADYILAIPDPCLDMSPDENAVLAFWTRELVHLFHEWLQPEQIVFKRFPPGNTKVIVSLPAHFVIDLHLLGINNVHKMLAAEASACARKGDDGRPHGAPRGAPDGHAPADADAAVPGRHKGAPPEPQPRADGT